MGEDTNLDLNEQEQIRREKLSKLHTLGIDTYPVGFAPDHSLIQVRNEFKDLSPESKTGKIVSIAGRVMLNRIAGKLIFATLRDGSSDLQIMISADSVGDESLDLWKEFVDLGDLVGLTGEVVTTKRGEGGSGLGMHLVYNLVTQALNGKISLESSLGEGVDILFDFPVIVKSSAASTL